MCNPIPSTKMTAREAAKSLAFLMESKMDLPHVDPVALRLFLCAHWKKVASMAHIIHDDES